jgi:hypothetical protein
MNFRANENMRGKLHLKLLSLLTNLLEGGNGEWGNAFLTMLRFEKKKDKYFNFLI